MAFSQVNCFKHTPIYVQFPLICLPKKQQQKTQTKYAYQTLFFLNHELMLFKSLKSFSIGRYHFFPNFQ